MENAMEDGIARLSKGKRKLSSQNIKLLKDTAAAVEEAAQAEKKREILTDSASESVEE
jgi:hypothetical protein